MSTNVPVVYREFCKLSGYTISKSTVDCENRFIRRSTRLRNSPPIYSSNSLTSRMPSLYFYSTRCLFVFLISIYQIGELQGLSDFSGEQ